MTTSLQGYIHTEGRLSGSLVLNCGKCLRVCWAPGPYCPACSALAGIIDLKVADKVVRKVREAKSPPRPVNYVEEDEMGGEG